VAVLAVAPALALDLRVLARPGDAPYPGMDRGQYNVLVSNRGPVQDAAKEILRRSPATFTDATPAGDRTVVGIGGWVWAGQLALNGKKYTTHPRFIYLDVNAADQAAANAARFVIVDGARPPGWFRLGHVRLVHRWSRPGPGPPLLLYDRGA
jgi:hypothetical protein